MKLHLTLAAIFLFVVASNGQSPEVSAEVGFPLNRGVEVRKLPIPEYPKAAKAAGFGGKIEVTVQLDENGNVVSADKADGPYPMCPSVTDVRIVSLRNAALASAKKAKLKMLSPESPREGLLVYTFVTPSQPAISGLATGETGYRIARVGEKSDASPNDKPLPDTVSGGVLNGTAMDLAKPKYPPAARAVHAGGTVSVQVLIDESGNVFSAEAVSGHPLLRRTSEIAACSSRFTQTLLLNKPVKVMGVITYNFVP